MKEIADQLLHARLRLGIGYVMQSRTQDSPLWGLRPLRERTKSYVGKQRERCTLRSEDILLTSAEFNAAPLSPHRLGAACSCPRHVPRQAQMY